jgi:transcriptional regulator with XRE-family HTH domain
MTDAERFGTNLFMARRRAGLSQAELAERADLHVTAISLLERGKRSPRLDTLLALLRALETRPEHLFKELA